MSTETHNGRWAYRLGRGAARVRRSFARGERSTVAWIVAQGLPAHFAKAALWMVKLVVLAVALYATSMLALLILFAIGAAWIARNADHDESEDWAIGAQADHKNSVFYDPINYSDDPDPRFDDDR